MGLFQYHSLAALAQFLIGVFPRNSSPTHSKVNVNSQRNPLPHSSKAHGDSMDLAGTQQEQPRPRPGDEDLEALWRAAKDDRETLAKLWQHHGLKLLKVVSRVADPKEIIPILAVAQETDPNAEQTVLEQTASAGNVALFQHMLQRMSKPLLGKWLRLHAINGGVEIWRALLVYKHDCISWEIGEHGDALGQAVLKRNTDLVRFLLAEGIDVQNSNFVGEPVLPAARAIGASPEIIDLLVAHGAPE